MCGIVGYIGTKKASPILINGLLKLEYRGYDSAGISTIEKYGLSNNSGSNIILWGGLITQLMEFIYISCRRKEKSEINCGA